MRKRSRKIKFELIKDIEIGKNMSEAECYGKIYGDVIACEHEEKNTDCEEDKTCYQQEEMA